MKYIIITTVYRLETDIWNLAQSNPVKWFAGPNPSSQSSPEGTNSQNDEDWQPTTDELHCTVKNNRALLLKQRDESTDSMIDKTKKCVEIAVSFLKSSPEADFFIAAHGSTYSELLPYLKKYNITLNFYSHDEDDDVYKEIKKLVESPTPDNFEAVCEEIEKKKIDNFRGHVQHRFNRIITPILIDFQGLEETSFNEDYWKEVVDDYRQNAQEPFRGLINLVMEIEEKVRLNKSLNKKAVVNLIDLLKQYPKKAAVLHCLVKEKGAYCPADSDCSLDPYQCIFQSFKQKKEKAERAEYKVEILFQWTSDVFRKCNSLS